MRAVRFVDQQPPIGGAVEHDLLPPRRGQRLVIAEHALPGGARMRRLDQGIGEIAKLAFVFGELEMRWLEPDAAGRLGAEPAMHVVVAEVAAGAAEIAATAAAEGCTNQDKHKSRERPKPGSPDRMAQLRHFKRPLSGAPTATATGCCTFFRSASAALVGWTFDPD